MSPVEIRVLGALMEKAKTTPEYYPLTLNSLTAACNQKTSRHPLTDYEEDEILSALDSLRDKCLALRVDVAGSRVAKFRENATATWELNSREYALTCVLLLRGPQTPGQLRQRTDRIYPFDGISEVEQTLEEMQQREEPPEEMIHILPKQPGTKEARYALWLHEPEEEISANSTPVADSPTLKQTEVDQTSKLEALEKRLSDLEKRLCSLEEELGTTS